MDLPFSAFVDLEHKIYDITNLKHYMTLDSAFDKITEEYKRDGINKRTDIKYLHLATKAMIYNGSDICNTIFNCQNNFIVYYPFFEQYFRIKDDLKRAIHTAILADLKPVSDKTFKQLLKV